MRDLRTSRRALLAVAAAIVPSLKARAARVDAAPGQDPGRTADRAAPQQHGGQATRPGTPDQTRAAAISLAAFGFRGDGVSDDTGAWRQAIAHAGAHGVRTVIVPAGVSLVAGPIADATHPLPPGLAFKGAGAALDDPGIPHSRLRYVGAGVCWDVLYPKGGPAATGRWGWASMTFECADPAGTMFSFGNPLGPGPHDDPVRDPRMYLQGIEFRGISAHGGRGTGDFLRACKTLEIEADALSSVYDFRRAFWLKGCDNSEIRCRMVGNNRAVMIERANAFGNNNRVDIHYVGAPERGFGGEPCYSIWDNANATTIGRGMLLEGVGPAAHLYLAGYGTTVWSPVLGVGAPFFRLAPEAREIAVYSPRCPVLDRVNTPLIDPPADPNLGDTQTDHRIRIVDAPRSIRAVLPEHPRILLSGFAEDRTPTLAPGDPRATSRFCTPFDFWATRGSPGGGGIKGFVRDPTIGDRWVIRLTKDGPVEQGLTLRFVVGVDIQPGKYTVVNRTRLAAGTSNAGWTLVATYDGSFLSNALAFATSAVQTTYRSPLDLSLAGYGKTVTLNLYNASKGRTGVDLLVEALGLVAVPEAGSHAA